MTALTPEDIALICARDGYLLPLEARPGEWYVINRFMYTCAIMGPIDRYGYKDRWCYHTLADAALALLDWKAKGFEDEPEGWHRHPDSGRRRDENGVEEIRL